MSSSNRRSLPDGVRIYEVGGAVRDALMGQPVADHDYLVVGATPEMMQAAGFRPVGRDFPVFLHPDTHEEYALARTERKSGQGYHGFTFYSAPEVTLEEDLARRDLTINALAKAPDGTLIDPYGGQRDLKDRVLRHVSPAFAEDPLRVLRVARFAARFDFTVADETWVLMRQLAESGELATLTPERVWQETARALMQPHPSRFLQVLRECNALPALLPEVAALYGVPQKPEYHPEVDTGLHVEKALDAAARFALSQPDRFPLEVRFALLCHDLGKALTPAEQLPDHNGHELRGLAPTRTLAQRLRVPHDCLAAALLVTRWHGRLFDPLFDEDASTLLGLLRAVDALRRPWQLRWLTAAAFVDRNLFFEAPPPDPIAEYLEQTVTALHAINYEVIAKAHQGDPKAIVAAIHAAQEAVITEQNRSA